MTRSVRHALAALIFVASGVACGASEERAEGSVAAAAGATSSVPAEGVESSRPEVIDLWAAGTAAFGVFVPDERPRTDRRDGEPRPPPLYTREGGARLAANPLYDYLFLNLERAYDAQAVREIAEGLKSPDAVSRKALLVRIPPISTDGEAAARARVREILDAGADGVVLPHVRSVEEARTAIAFFDDAGASVWSPANPGGTVIAMLMVEDPAAVAAADRIASLGGFSVLACGIGSLTAALDGDRAAAEEGNLRVLDESKAAGLADMITANEQDVADRVEQGFLALLMAGPGPTTRYGWVGRPPDATSLPEVT